MHSYRAGLGFEEGKYSALPKISLVDVPSTEYKWTILELKFCSKEKKILRLNFH